MIQMRRQRRVVPLTGVRSRRLSPEEIEHLTRLATAARITAGTGGFDSHQLGEIDLYASNLDNAVLLQAEESGTVVTPDDAGGFLAALAAGTPVTAAADRRADPTT